MRILRDFVQAKPGKVSAIKAEDDTVHISLQCGLRVSVMILDRER